MTTWKAHSLAHPASDHLVLAKGDKVIATVDLEGVPAGTVGKIVLANGFNWLRYRVRFSNGIELNDLDGRHLKSAKRRRSKS